MKHRHNQAGFTLIEILVVVAIIGVISGVVFTALSQARLKGRDSKRKGDLVQLQKALEIYYNTNSGYPSTAGAWRALPNSGGNCPANTVTNSGINGYIPNLAPTFVGFLPADPKPGAGVCTGYAYRSDGINYKILSNSVAGVGGPESFPTVGQPFYDPARPTTAWMVTNNASATSGW